MKNEIKQLKNKNVHLLHSLPSLKVFQGLCSIDLKSSLFICDQKLKKKMKSWYKGKNIYFVKGGENLKNIEKLPSHVKKIAKIEKKLNHKISYFIAVGGGSVTDFTGFFSSIYKRGCPVVYIPSTLLSVIDASHGGKTALNTDQIKNYLGTYHKAKAVLIIKELICQTSKRELLSANGELVKIALIQGGTLYHKLKAKIPVCFENIWPLIPLAIQAKLRIVDQDPLEQKGIRKCLNLGHTLGHCLESYYGITHGQAVAFGLDFAIRWSVKKKLLLRHQSIKYLDILYHYTQIGFVLPIPEKKLEKLIQQDKKAVNLKKINFVFLKNLGKPIVKSVWIKDLISFYNKHQLEVQR